MFDDFGEWTVSFGNVWGIIGLVFNVKFKSNNE